SLCLTNSELLIGATWDRSSELERALSDPSRRPILLYPGEGAVDIVRAPPPDPVTLVVIDGTWPQTKKVMRESLLLTGMPRYAFVPTRPSQYRIRKEPNGTSVATIEAFAVALGALEGNPSRFDELLAPFRTMVDFQIDCEQRLHGGQVRHAQRRARPRHLRI